MERIETLDDPRVAPYRNLRDRTLRGQNLFIAEGRLLVERLLASRFPAQSVLVAPKWADTFAALAGSRTPVYVADESLLRRIVGFPFHLGVLAVGQRVEAPALDRFLAGFGARERIALVVCPEMTKADNLGLVFRSAAAMGIDGAVLGERSCDALSRRALRLSMGATLWLPFTRSARIADDLIRVKRQWSIELVAAVLEPSARRLGDFTWPRRAALVLGNETEGIRPEWLDACDHRVTIPMQPPVDSLNVGVAAGILMDHWRRATA